MTKTKHAKSIPRVAPWQLFAAVVVATGVGLCTRDRLVRDPPPPASARALGIYSPEPPGLSPRDAQAALARDARRREERFFDAAEAGHTFKSTRVTEDELGALAPEVIFELGAQLFNYRFSLRDGLGEAGNNGGRTLRRVHLGARGGPDAYTCAECHRRGGPAGAGDASDNTYLDGDGDRPDSAFERNPPPLSGAGLIELLAREMTGDLAALRRRAQQTAQAEGRDARIALVSKGVAFGHLTVSPAGNIDVSEVRGVDRDLVVRPFGYKGHASTLTDIVEDELAIHHGMQTDRLVRGGDERRIGTFGPPDPDGDGVTSEISDGQLAALTLFVAMQEVPAIDLPARSDFMSLWPLGKARFDEIGCARCHAPSLPLEHTVYELPLSNGRVARVDLARHGASPRLEVPDDGGPVRVHLFSDLRRHVMGPNLREVRSYQNVLPSHFLTRPLWGIARSGPYLHDARSPTLDDAILQHSGEALEARDAYAKLSDEDRAPIRIFLMSLSRARRISSP